MVFRSLMVLGALLPSLASAATGVCYGTDSSQEYPGRTLILVKTDLIRTYYWNTDMVLEVGSANEKCSATYEVGKLSLEDIPVEIPAWATRGRLYSKNKAIDAQSYFHRLVLERNATFRVSLKRTNSDFLNGVRYTLGQAPAATLEWIIDK